MEDKFIINHDELPPSVNNYLKPSAKIVNGKAVVHMYESKVAKDFKKRFIAYLKREVKKQGWNSEITKDGHWYLDCVFYQSRTNEDNNNYYKILCDSLTGIVIDDDKNILVRTQKVMYDSKNPKFSAVLHQVKYKGVFKSEEDEQQFVNSNCIGCKRFNRNCSILKKAREGRIQEEVILQNEFNICTKRG